MQTERIDSFVVARGPIPSDLSPGVLYVNPQASRAHHLCACGCGLRVMTPLNDIEWKLSGSGLRPSLYPSVGNWNFECQSHYFIQNGKTRWARSYSRAEIEANRQEDLKPYRQTGWLEAINIWLRRIKNLMR